ncbi:MAG: efflux transporter outer membrane subunit [Thiogranum sp.]
MRPSTVREMIEMRANRWVLTLVILLGGCSLAPTYERPPSDNPGAWRVEYKDAAETANSRWWELFGDPVLDRLVETALRENKDVRIAAARVVEFAARVDIFRAGYFPQIGYDGEATRNRASREVYGGGNLTERKYNNYTAAANLGWELDLWGRIRNATEAARAELLAQEENRRAVILSLVSAVANTYVNLRQYDRQLEVAKDTMATRAESLRLFELKRKGGVVSDLEVAQVRTEYEQAAAAVPPIERQIALTENTLSILLGSNPHAIPRGKSIDALVLPPVPAGMPSSLLEHRPDIRVAEQALIAANARIGVARAQYFPAISLTGLFGYASESLSDLLQNSANVWTLGGSASGPIFSGGRISAELRASEAVQRQALVGYLQTVQGAFRDVDDALVSVQKTREELVAEDRRVAALADYARLALLRYNEGYTTYIDVLDAQSRLFDAQLQYISVQGSVYSSLVNTYKAMGGGWVVRAEDTANAVDFPPVQQDVRTLLDFPPPTRPAAVQVVNPGDPTSTP